MKKVMSIVAIVVCAVALITNQTELGIELGNAIACYECMPSFETINVLACYECMPSNESISTIA